MNQMLLYRKELQCNQLTDPVMYCTEAFLSLCHRIDLQQRQATLFHCQVFSYQRNDEPVTEAAANSLCREL